MSLGCIFLAFYASLIYTKCYMIAVFLLQLISKLNRIFNEKNVKQDINHQELLVQLTNTVEMFNAAWERKPFGFGTTCEWVIFVSKYFHPFSFPRIVCVVCVFVDTSLNCSSERWNPKPLNQCLHRNSVEAAQRSLWQSSSEILIFLPSPPLFPHSTQLSHRNPDNPFSWDRY